MVSSSIPFGIPVILINILTTDSPPVKLVALASFALSFLFMLVMEAAVAVPLDWLNSIIKSDNSKAPVPLLFAYTGTLKFISA